ncbi:MAG: FAD-binding oxidoreductase [Gemmatimonadota bacterium]|nr:FAD-binding oxidoreductase [Gemmatimonadota bacterium]
MSQDTAPRIDPGPPLTDGDDALSPDTWGFRDTQFVVLPNGNAMLTGKRYALSGTELPALVPWVRSVLANPFIERPASAGHFPAPVPEPKPPTAFLRAAEAFLARGHVSIEPLDRLRRGHGHTLDEMYEIKHHGLPRVPDAVVFPGSTDDVVKLVQLAVEHDVVLVPYGGGTNVSEALRCPRDEPRAIVAVDMGRMNRIRWIDKANRLACIEAGAVGRHITDQLAVHGVTMGHEPDSYEFSTMGGWVATNASGMKKNRYGNIEDLVVDLEAVMPGGVIRRGATTPRESVGPDPRRWLFGSEGTLGIVTSATVKIFPLPERTEHDALLFPSFEAGVAFLNDLARSGAVPASVRLVDNLQFQLSQTLRGPAVGLQAFKRKAERWFVTKVRGLDPTSMVACTLLYEGTHEEVARQMRTVARLSRARGAMRAGSENGKKGYQLTFGIAYVRDFVLRYGILAESFETSVEWSRALELCARVKARVRREAEARGVKGPPFVTCRVTQVYQTGVCIYFYLGLNDDDLADPLGTYGAVEHAARDEILQCGGALSHHHGVGKRRQGFLPEVHAPVALEWLRGLKKSVDPQNVFGIGNL